MQINTTLIYWSAFIGVFGIGFAKGYAIATISSEVADLKASFIAGYQFISTMAAAVLLSLGTAVSSSAMAAKHDPGTALALAQSGAVSQGVLWGLIWGAGLGFAAGFVARKFQSQ